MKNGKNNNKARRTVYKKWWVLVIIIAILSAASGCNGDSNEQETDTFIAEVEEVINGTIGENESITDVVLKDSDLCVTVDLSKANPEPFTIEDLAISRTGSITDAILELNDYDGQWNTITIDFGDIGKITNKKDDIKENEFGMRYFPSENFTLE